LGTEETLEKTSQRLYSFSWTRFKPISVYEYTQVVGLKEAQLEVTPTRPGEHFSIAVFTSKYMDVSP
jgi:hypothetical protein